MTLILNELSLIYKEKEMLNSTSVDKSIVFRLFVVNRQVGLFLHLFIKFTKSHRYTDFCGNAFKR